MAAAEYSNFWLAEMWKFLSETTRPYNLNVAGMLPHFISFHFNETFHMAFRWSCSFLCSELSIFIDSNGASWSYGSWSYNYLCNQYLSPLTLWVQNPLRRDVLDTTLCDKVCQWLVTGRLFSPDTSVSSINKTDCLDITEILCAESCVNRHIPRLLIADNR